MTLPKDPIKYAEAIAKMSERAIKQWSDKEACEKLSIAAKLRYNKKTPEERKQYSIDKKVVMNRPDVKQKISVSKSNRPRTELELAHLHDMSEGNKGKKRAPFSEEHRRNMSASKTGTKATDETKQKQSDARRGVPKSEEHKRKISESNKGRIVTEETRQKLSLSQKGKPRPMSEEHINNLTKANQKRSQDPIWKVRIDQQNKLTAQNPVWIENHTAAMKDFETRKRMSVGHLGVTYEEWPGFVNVGDYCGKWTDPKYKVRKRVRARFNDRCIICGKNREQNGGKRMGVHHVYLNKDACCEGDKVDWLFATLCPVCHGKYGHNNAGILKIREILAVEYGNKCMLSLEEYNMLYPQGGADDKKWGYADGR